MILTNIKVTARVAYIAFNIIIYYNRTTDISDTVIKHVIEHGQFTLFCSFRKTIY